MPTRRHFLLQSGAAALLSGTELDLQSSRWNARWVFPAGAPANTYGIYHFRCSFALGAVPSALKVHVTGDSRYELFVNGVKVSWGPARGDLYHWRYETVDLAPHLRAGNNVLAAVVWNESAYAGLAQWSNRTGFLLQAADSDHEKLVNTGTAGWKATQDDAYQPFPLPGKLWSEIGPGYYAISPMERFDAAKYPWGWQVPVFDDSAWTAVENGPPAAARDASDSPSRWMLVPRPIPVMEETPIRLARLRQSSGVTPPAEFPARKAAVTVPANTKAVLLLDQDVLTCAFPELELSGGRGAEVTVRYIEAPYEALRPRVTKRNRNDVDGKILRGYFDRIVPDGERRTWRPLFWRTWRYLQITIETKAEPLVLEDLRAVYTGYPFVVKAKFESGNALHQKIMEVGWRTARLCAHESYMDCPYWEQLQYAGDTRIQALVSLYMTGDHRLMRNAIEQLDSSRTPEGATYSRAPSALQQYIPPFCLWWIGMVHDYCWYVDDPAFVRQMLPGVRAVLGWYTSFLKDNGLLGPMPWWNYVDWVPKWPNGRPPSEKDTMPATIQLQLAMALQWAGELEAAVGDAQFARRWKVQATRLTRAIGESFWSAEKRLFSEDLAHAHFSQHANVLAVLADVAEAGGQRELMTRVEADKSLYQCTVYFRYYLDRAMVKAGLGDRYLNRLGTWEFMLKEGLTTWAEMDSPNTRSDCHAWGASPNIEFFRTVLGVDSAAPGFRKIRVTPRLGPLQRASGVIPHPKGLIEVRVERGGPTGLIIDVKAPAGVEVEKG